jgi:hypothetical protein
MDFLQLTVNGKPALFRIAMINGVIPPLKGKGTLIVSGDQELTLQVDESFEEICEALNALEVEILECAND